MLFTISFLLPSRAHAWAFLVPAGVELATLTATSEAVIASTAGIAALRFSLKEGGRQTTRHAAKYLFQNVLASTLKLSKQQLKELKHAKLIWNPRYAPKKGKQLLYYTSLLHNGQKYYKIGITTQSLKKRYPREYYSAKIEVIMILELPKKSAFVLEQIIVRTFILDRVFNQAILRKDKGFTEVFQRDVLGLDGMILSILRLFK